MKCLFLLPVLLVFIACNKVKKDDPQPLPPPPSERFRLLTEHRWSMTHEYVDSTAYAKANLNLWPLNTTDDYMDYSDTCSWDSESIFLADGRWKLKKSPSCDQSVSEDIGHWKLANNSQDFVNVGQDTFHIVELNTSVFKMYYKRYTWVQGQLVLTEYCMWTFNSR